MQTLAFNSTWGTKEGNGPLMIGASMCVRAVPQVDRWTVTGEAVEALVVGVVRVDQVAGVGLVHELLGKAVGAARQGQSIAGAALRRVAVAQVVDTQAVIRAFDLQGGGVVSEPYLGVVKRGGDLLQRVGADCAEKLTRLAVSEDEGLTTAADVVDRLARRGRRHEVLA